MTVTRNDVAVERRRAQFGNGRRSKQPLQQHSSSDFEMGSSTQSVQSYVQRRAATTAGADSDHQSERWGGESAGRGKARTEDARGIGRTGLRRAVQEAARDDGAMGLGLTARCRRWARRLIWLKISRKSKANACLL